VREALFNIWQGTIADCRWLDLCAGNGSMGAEALCRGAKEVVGIEQSKPACAIALQNWQKVASPEQTFKIIRGDVVRRLPDLSEKTFDRIYFDPPYASPLYKPVLEAIAQSQILDRDGEMAVEHDAKSWQAIEIAGWEICREKSYGKTALTFYRVNQ
jgi:16S rRNA (guanine(966)-N(2))-methyltransferase RsmD